jgi:hypothetical protein|tara:strand:+ start:592 stop:981 length:390 start_codon:yes stop_codon:yes gene_type:complete
MTIAGGAILPARFVKADSTDGQVIQADLNAQPMGVSGQSAKDARNDVNNANHAESGDHCQVNDGTGNDTDRTVLLELGGTVAFGGAIMPDANGKGIAATTGKYYGAIALSDGVSGDLIPVRPVLTGLVA